MSDLLKSVSASWHPISRDLRITLWAAGVRGHLVLILDEEDQRHLVTWFERVEKSFLPWIQENFEMLSDAAYKCKQCEQVIENQPTMIPALYRHLVDVHGAKNLKEPKL